MQAAERGGGKHHKKRGRRVHCARGCTRARGCVCAPPSNVGARGTCGDVARVGERLARACAWAYRTTLDREGMGCSSAFALSRPPLAARPLVGSTDGGGGGAGTGPRPVEARAPPLPRPAANPAGPRDRSGLPTRPPRAPATATAAGEARSPPLPWARPCDRAATPGAGSAPERAWCRGREPCVPGPEPAADAAGPAPLLPRPAPDPAPDPDPAPARDGAGPLPLTPPPLLPTSGRRDGGGDLLRVRERVRSPCPGGSDDGPVTAATPARWASLPRLGWLSCIPGCCRCCTGSGCTAGAPSK